LKGKHLIKNWNIGQSLECIYLAENKRLDTSHVVYQAARFSHTPKNSHAIAIKRALSKENCGKVMYVCPDGSFKLSWNVGSKFGALFMLTSPLPHKKQIAYSYVNSGFYNLKFSLHLSHCRKILFCHSPPQCVKRY